MATKTTVTPSKVSRDDLERNFRALQSSVQGKVDEKKPAALSIAAAGGLLVVLLIFFLGKRSGKKKSTLVEIRRF